LVGLSGIRSRLTISDSMVRFDALLSIVREIKN
jgi:hypothetical protein